MEETKESEKDRERMRSNVRKIHKRSKEVRADIPTAPSARNRILQAEMRPSLMWSIPKAMRAEMMLEKEPRRPIAATRTAISSGRYLHRVATYM
jgi:hypothetical protein